MQQKMKIEIGDKVKPNVSIRINQIGKVVGINKNLCLPVAVVFDDNVEWDFREHELIKL